MTDALWLREGSAPKTRKARERVAFVLEKVPPLVKQGMNRHQIADAIDFEYTMLVKYMKYLGIKCRRAKSNEHIAQKARPFLGFKQDIKRVRDRIESLKISGFHY